jgi:hypothetical protein
MVREVQHPDMAHTDFYLAASGLIPALAFASVVELKTKVAVRTRELADRLNTAMPWAQLAGSLTWGTFFTWAEFVCLRSLETGHSAFGGTTVVWFALGVLGLQINGVWFLGHLALALPARFPPVDTPDVERDAAL